MPNIIAPGVTLIEIMEYRLPLSDINLSYNCPVWMVTPNCDKCKGKWSLKQDNMMILLYLG